MFTRRVAIRGAAGSGASLLFSPLQVSAGSA